MGEDLNMKILGSDTTKFSVVDATGDSLTINYHTLVNNNPSKNGNYIAIWQGDNLQIPWGDTPLWEGAIDASRRDGSYVLDGLNLTNLSYVVGYSVASRGEGGDNFCAVAPIPPSGGFRVAGNSQDLAGDGESPAAHIAYLDKLRAESQCFVPEISLEALQATVARIKYYMPEGYNPQAKRNWVGLWEGMSPNLYQEAPIYSVRVKFAEDVGSVSLLWDFKRDATYTVGYFASGWNEDEKKGKQNAPVCSLTFRT